LGRYQGKNEGPAVRAAVESLQKTLVAEKIPLKVAAGADVRIDERLVSLLAAGRVLKLGDGAYLLLELPHDTWIDPTSMLVELAAAGIRPIISHPERYPLVVEKPAIVDHWRSAGASLQLTAGSLAGDFGSAAQRASWYWLETGKAALVAGDAHNTSSRKPRISKVLDLIERRLGLPVARRVCIDNPARVFSGGELVDTVRQNEPLSW
jgi:protein-tyrosine phosphatase